MNMLQITAAPVGEGLMGVRVAGEVDIATAEQVAEAVRATLADHHPREIHLDMAAVTFLDSSGINMLLQARREATDQQVLLRVVNAHRRVARVLDLTGLLEIFQDGTLED